VRAVDGVSFAIPEGSTLGVVGESGCGKSTTGRALLRLVEPTQGTVRFDGQDLRTVDRRDLRKLRSDMAMVFQDPMGALDPLQSVGSAVQEPLLAHDVGGSRREREKRVGELLDMVGLSRRAADRLPREFSGGQRQRIVIARALATSPRFVVFDEPIAALDASIQAQILNLIMDLQRELSLTYMFITHDLAAVEHVADRLIVMYLGRVVEEGSAREIDERPGHPYTRALSSAVLEPEPPSLARRNRIVLAGDPPDPANPPSGCPFRTRCWLAMDVCAEVRPELAPLELPTHRAACHAPAAQVRAELADPHGVAR
jgi:oligopeptide/dipeptide ABC transporter ATP-binding protein